MSVLLGQRVNGRADLAPSPQDRGLLYGDGLFETVAIRHGRPRRWERHLERLAQGAERLGLPLPAADLLHAELRALIGDCGVEQAVAKLVITRGSGGRGYRPPAHPEPTRLLSLHAWPGYPEAYRSHGVRARICATRLASAPALAGLKHLNRLEQVLARAEWEDANIAEGLMLDEAGHVIEATQSNVFIVEAGRLLTPDLSRSGVAGTVRARVLELAAELGLVAEVTSLSLERVQHADEIFLTNAVIELWPLRELAGRGYVAPGPVTQRVDAALRDCE